LLLWAKKTRRLEYEIESHSNSCKVNNDDDVDDDDDDDDKNVFHSLSPVV